MSCCDECEEHENEIAIGKLQRQNPLPTGVYWLDVIGDKRSGFAEFLFDNARTINVLKTESFGAVSWPDCPITEGDCSPPRDWYKFQVSEPTPFDNVRYGFPNIIGPGDDIESSQDTADVQTPPGECDTECKLTRAAIAVGVLAAGAIALAIVVRR